MARLFCALKNGQEELFKTKLTQLSNILCEINEFG